MTKKTHPKKRLNCRKCGCDLDRVRRSILERLFLVRATFACGWCNRRRRVYFSKPREISIEYGAAIPTARRVKASNNVKASSNVKVSNGGGAETPKPKQRKTAKRRQVPRTPVKP